MEARPVAHPSSDTLAALALGTLDQDAADTALSHLDTCADCRAAVAAQPADSFLQGLRAAHNPNCTPAPAGLLTGISVTCDTLTVSAAAASPAPAEIPNLPEELADQPHYQVIRELGRGGMGVVYLARNKLLNRPEVLKVVSKALLELPGTMDRFLREIQMAAQLKHDNVIAAYSAFRAGDLLVFAMEYVEGEDLAQYVQARGPLPVADACRYAQQAARGLQHAFEKGMVHRDIKPHNLILAREGGNDIVKVLDFGLAKATSEKAPEKELTGSGRMLGTPDYAAPEQLLDASHADIRADIYSLGCTLYFLLNGAPPFKGRTAFEVMQAHHTAEAPALNLTRPETPAELAAAVQKMMAKEPARRYQTPLEVARALAPFIQPEAKGAAAGDAYPVRSRDALETTTDRKGKTNPSITPAPRQLPREARPPVRKTWLLVVAAMAAVTLPLLWFAGGIVKVKTRDGILTVEVNEPNAEVYVDGDRVTVTWDKGGKRAEIHVKPGTRKVEVKKEGFTVFGEEVTLEDGRRHVLVAKLEQLNAPNPAKEIPKPGHIVPPMPSAELEALKGDRIPPEALAAAGHGDPKRAPARLVAILGDPQPSQSAFVRTLAYSADGRWLASGCDDKSILVREAATGRVQRLLSGHAGAVRSVAFSKDSKTLISASIDGTVKFWTMEQAAEPKTLRPGLGGLWGMAVSADGRFMAAGGTTGGVKLWKWGQWQAPLDFPADPNKPWSAFTGWKNNDSLALSPDGRYLAVRTQETKQDAPVYLYKTADGQLVKTLPGSWAGDERIFFSMGMSFSPDGKYLVSFAPEKSAEVWDVASGKRLGQYPTDQFGAVAISPDNQKIALVRNFRVGVEVYDRTTQRRERVIGHGLGDGMSVAFGPGGNTLAAGFWDGSVHLWNTKNWEEIFLQRGHARSIHSVQFSSDGRAVLSTGSDNTVRRWDLSRPGENRILTKMEARLQYACYSPDRKKYVTLVSPVWYEPTQTTVVWDSATQSKLFPVEPPIGLDGGIVFSPDNKLLAGSSAPSSDTDKSGFVYLWDAQTGKEAHRFSHPVGGQFCLPAFSENGKLLAAASSNQFKVWEVESGNELNTWQDDSLIMPGMCAVAFSPDAHTLAIGHTNGRITIWGPTTGTSIKTLKGHLGKVNSLKYTRDGQKLVSAGEDGTIRVWNPQWERAIDVIGLGSSNGPVAMDIDPSGKYLVAAGQGTMMLIFRIKD